MRLDDSTRDRPVFVAIEADAVVGFAVCGPPRDRGMSFDAELYVLNVDPAHWRRGVGRRLFAHCVDNLAGRGVRSFYLWVLIANERARRFYQDLGGKPQADRLRDADFDGVGVPEVPYVWPRLPILATDGRLG